jgi:hypothetical protein
MSTTDQQLPPSPLARLYARATVAMFCVAVSSWTFARLIAIEDIHFATFLGLWLIIGVFAGVVLGNVRGALVGACAGLVVGFGILFYDFWLWMIFTLPPHPKTDF